MLVELFGRRVLGIHDQRKCCDLFDCLQATIYRAGYEQLAQPLASMIGMACQSTHAKTRDWVARQLLSVGIAQAGCIHLRSAQGVVAQNETGRCGVGQYKDGADAFAAMLSRKAMQVLVKLGLATSKASAVMEGWVKRVFFQHDSNATN